ncbi:MAG TPA: cation:proton antiporter [Casimicrobiaceae bacterium]
MPPDVQFGSLIVIAVAALLVPLALAGIVMAAARAGLRHHHLAHRRRAAPGPALVAFLLTSTSLGAVLAVLREHEMPHEPYGQFIMVTTAVADFGTTLLLTVFFSVDARPSAASPCTCGWKFSRSPKVCTNLNERRKIA